MSKSLFANPKKALGFAGVTIVIALAASFGASRFLPSQEPAAPVVVEAEAEAEAKPAQPQTAASWADEDFADDWNASAIDTANGFGSSGNVSEKVSQTEPVFDDYAPQTGSAQSSSSTSRRGGGNSGRVRSGAAANAPTPQPPGGADNGIVRGSE